MSLLFFAKKEPGMKRNIEQSTSFRYRKNLWLSSRSLKNLVLAHLLERVICDELSGFTSSDATLGYVSSKGNFVLR
jgi:hypothetical protein